MLRRAGTKKDGDQVVTSSLKRRLNILKAIDDRGLQNGKVTGKVINVFYYSYFNSCEISI